jgi:hypothetical protein
VVPIAVSPFMPGYGRIMSCQMSVLIVDVAGGISFR